MEWEVLVSSKWRSGKVQKVVNDVGTDGNTNHYNCQLVTKGMIAVQNSGLDITLKVGYVKEWSITCSTKGDDSSR